MTTESEEKKTEIKEEKTESVFQKWKNLHKIDDDEEDTSSGLFHFLLFKSNK